MLKKKIVSLSVALLMIINLCVIIPVMALSNKNTDLSLSLDIKDNKNYYSAGDEVTLELNLNNYNENSKGIVGFQYDFQFSDELFDSIEIDKSSAKINSGDTYQVIDKGNKSITGLYFSSIEKPTNKNNNNTETDDLGSYYVLPKNNKTLVRFTLAVKENVSADMLEKDIIDDNYSVVFESRDENTKINTSFSAGKINVINTKPSITVNGKEYTNSADLGSFDKDVTISSNRKDDVVKVYKDGELVQGNEFLQNGEYKVTVTDIAGKEISVSFTIAKVELESISIERKPEKLNYFVGDKIDLTGGEIVENYSDGTKSEPIKITEDMVDIKSFEKAGQQEVIVRYKDLETSFNVTVDEQVKKTLERIEASTDLECVYETQELSNKDFEVVAYFDDGTKSQVFGFKIDNLYKDVLVGEDATITISYQDKIDSVVLPVREREIKNIEVASKPDITEYVESKNQKLDLTGGTIKVNYNVGESPVIDMTNEEVKTEGFNSTKLGEQDIKVEYKEKTATFKVNVVEKELVSITATKPNKTDYFVGQDVDLTGVVLTAKYNNGESQEIDIKDCDVSSVDNVVAGEKEITISYQSVKTTIKVNYKDLEVSNIELVGTPKTEYVEGSVLDISGLSLNVYYKEVEETQKIPVTLDMCKVPDMNTVGNKTVIINYKGLSLSFDINVSAKALENVVFEGELQKTQYLQGQDIDLSGITVTAKYNNNTQENVTNDVIITFDNMTVSENALIKLAYEGFEKEYTVSVLSRENVDLFKQKVYKLMSNNTEFNEQYYQELLNIKQELDNDIAKMSALELQEVKSTYEEFKQYLSNVESKIANKSENNTNTVNDNKVSQNNDNPQQQTQNNDSKLAQTGDNSNINVMATVVIVIMVVMVVAVVVLVIVKKKK